MTYAQLTREQRYQIYALQKAGHNQTETAVIICVHKATVSRELRRNRGGRGYRPRQAHELAMARRQATHVARIPPATWALVVALLRQEWSPEQIAGWLAREHSLSLSHERIYRYVYADKRAGGMLYRRLRCQKVRRKRYGAYDRRGRIADRRSIEERPAVVERRQRVGDWEADTIIGRGHRQAIVSLVERKSRFCLLTRVERNTAEAVGRAVIALLQPVVGQVLTITSDNGREFSNHQVIAAGLGADFYFAHPYASWERGTNENTNGLVRQYVPKKSDFSKITDAALHRVMQRLNNRPRKTLGFRTPQQVFFKQQAVALQS